MHVPSRRVFLTAFLLVVPTVIGACSENADQPREIPSAAAIPESPGILAGPTEYALRDIGPGGGIVFYVSRDGFPCGEDMLDTCNYLEVSPYADEVRRQWDAPLPPQSGSSDIGAGLRNTLDIIGRGRLDPGSSAAAYASSYRHGGMDDWYLPSRDECHELAIARELLGGFELATYWTSTERGGEGVWYQDFLNGFQFLDDGSSSYLVRPIRAF